jgi:riboflavin kinase / FMN adenylyltransferase
VIAGGGGRLTLSSARDGTVVTVGTFDGVHRGHWHVLEVLRAAAHRLGRPSVLVTFDPHPLTVVRPESAPRLLTTPSEKVDVLAESGVNYAVFLRFDRELADYPPERFVDEILIRRFGMVHLVIGYDHGFGKGRSGDVETLQRIGADRGFAVEVVEAVAARSEPVSSTRIRRALEAGDVAGAAAGLGRPYSLRAMVVAGDGRGRELGFPTANLRPADEAKLIPAEGIYAVRVHLRARSLQGVMHVGSRPTFPGAAPTIELHIFDFDQDIYGAEVLVFFHARIRDVARFESVDELIVAMTEDCRVARSLLTSGAEAKGAIPADERGGLPSSPFGD